MNPKSEPAGEYSGPEGRYANYFEVGHNASDFILDFGQLYSEGGEAKLHTRIVTTPKNVIELLSLLRASVDEYEHTFGSVHGDSQARESGQ